VLRSQSLYPAELRAHEHIVSFEQVSVSGNLEVEVKIRFDGDPEAARALVESRGFKVAEARLLETNIIFDRNSAELRRGDQLLRLRRTGNIARVTYKGPQQRGPYKSREEIEFDVSDVHAFELVLERLGYLPRFRYEKYRTTFAAPGEPGEVTVDETPIGIYLELEGPPQWIDATAQRLGFSARDYITASYTTLYEQYRQSHQDAAQDMIFAGDAHP